MARSVGMGSTEAPSRYRKLRRASVILISLVALVPLFIMTVINFQQFDDVLSSELREPIKRLIVGAKKSLEEFISERVSALTFIINDRSFDELAQEDTFQSTFLNLKKAVGGFVDLNLIDSEGNQRAHAGSHPLEDAHYGNEAWFSEIALGGVHVSDVFLGHRGYPHFVIAVCRETPDGGFYVLRASVNSDVLDDYVKSIALRPSSDAFIINTDGILQTPARSADHGHMLGRFPFAVPTYSSVPELIDIRDRKGQDLIMGYAHIEDSPFILMVIKRPREFMKGLLSLKRQLLWFLAASTLVILLVIFWGSTYMVNRIKSSDLRRAQAMHDIEHTNRMASIGRLAAGVAHEVNNPLAIISERAGLLEDLITRSEETPPKQKLLDNVVSILSAVARCSTITHRLLGFAKRMDVHTETISMENLINDVLGFLGKESSYRNIAVNIHIPDDVPAIESDRGQLQQVFLNIINNAFEAVADGGHIDIAVTPSDDASISVSIGDDGPGISPENLKKVFDPFFTTKAQHGTGLGLSITYGIVEKLGGDIDVVSPKGKGTTFIVTLPLEAPVSGATL